MPLIQVQGVPHGHRGVLSLFMSVICVYISEVYELMAVGSMPLHWWHQTAFRRNYNSYWHKIVYPWDMTHSKCDISDPNPTWSNRRSKSRFNFRYRKDVRYRRCIWNNETNNRKIPNLWFWDLSNMPMMVLIPRNNPNTFKHNPLQKYPQSANKHWKLN